MRQATAKKLPAPLPDIPASNQSESSYSEGDAAPRQHFFKRLLHWMRTFLRLNSGDASLREALEEVLKEHEEENKSLPQEEQTLLKNVLNFGELTASDIMVPRAQITAVPEQVTLEQLKAHILEQRHTRIPVYQRTLDDIKGFLHVKDLLPMMCGDQEFNLSGVIRQALFIPPSMKILDLLLKMRVSGVHIAIVIDEYGGTDGLLTLEDLFEEIVGEIHDEHDEKHISHTLRWGVDGAVIVDARTPIAKIEEDLNLPLNSEQAEEQYDTLGGCIFYLAKKVPLAGEVVKHSSGAEFTILEADPRRVHKIRIRRPEQVAANSNEHSQ